MTHTPIDNATLEAMVKAANEAAAGHPVDEYYLVSPRMMAAALAAAPEPFKAVKERGTTNPCDKIFDHKWLSPECVETGCKSLLLVHRAERAEELADKYKWQVRDTCARAEKTEQSLVQYQRGNMMLRDELASLRALLAEAGEALTPLRLILRGHSYVEDHVQLHVSNDHLAKMLASIQSALRDASPTTEKPK